MEQSLEKMSSVNGLTSSIPGFVNLPRVKVVCVIGAGLVGATTSAVLAYRNPGTYFIVVDSDEARIDAWNANEPPFHEPGLAELLATVRVNEGCVETGTKARHSDDYINHFRHHHAGSEHERPKENVSPEEASSTGPKRHRNLCFTTDIGIAVMSSQMIIIAVNTPVKNDNCGWDLTFFDAAVRSVAELATSDKIVVVKSTVPCGTGIAALKLLARYKQPGVSFHLLSSPEFLIQGRVIEDLLFPARVVIGSHATDRLFDWPTLQLTGLYSSWVAADRLLVMSTTSAELAKIASNAMIAQRISTVNSLSAICESAGATISDVALACGLDPRIGPECLHAGLGFGGSCLEKDLLGLTDMALNMNLPKVAMYWEQVLSMNDYQQRRLFHRILDLFDDSLAGVKVACLGFAYKSGTGDPKGSLVKHLVHRLRAHGARVSIHDPQVFRIEILAELGRGIKARKDELEVCAGPYEACYAAELIVITTDADAYRRLNWGAISVSLVGKRAVFDLRGVVDKAELARYGITVNKVGE